MIDHLGQQMSAGSCTRAWQGHTSTPRIPTKVFQAYTSTGYRNKNIFLRPELGYRSRRTTPGVLFWFRSYLESLDWRWLEWKYGLQDNCEPGFQLVFWVPLCLVLSGELDQGCSGASHTSFGTPRCLKSFDRSTQREQCLLSSDKWWVLFWGGEWGEGEAQYGSIGIWTGFVEFPEVIVQVGTITCAICFWWGVSLFRCFWSHQ